MNLIQLTELLKKSLQLTETASHQQALSNIEKDILLSNIRKMYDIALELQPGIVQKAKTEEPATKANVVESVSTQPTTQTVTPEVIEEKLPTTEPQNVTQDEPVISEAIVLETETAGTEIAKEPEVVEVIEENQQPAEVKKKQPSFDELVDKVKEQFKETPNKPNYVAPEEDDDVPVFFSDLKFDKLFDTEYVRELSDRLSSAKVEDIGRAMGLNEKIFTVNELFRGDNNAFDKAVRTLQGFETFEQAKQYISEELAPTYDWLSPGKFKKAKEFIKIVKRKFA